jgi:fructose-bisphosphate aldolase, class II
MHQDHGNSVATCMSAIENGFTSVMMDGSLKEDGKTPADYDYNVARHVRVVEAGARRGVSVEGELGCLGSLETGMGEKEDGHGAEGKLSHDQLLTDPDEAAASSPRPASTRWPSPSAPATAPTSSRASRTAKCWR